MRIIIGNDHAGYPLKRIILKHLRDRGFDVRDVGADNPDTPASWACEGDAVGQAMASGQGDLGIAICGTGVGISISVNKHPGVRGALCANEYMARMARQHNDANVLCLGARVIGSALALSIVDAFLAEPFESGGRHQARVEELQAIEKREMKTREDH